MPTAVPDLHSHGRALIVDRHRKSWRTAGPTQLDVRALLE